MAILKESGKRGKKDSEVCEECDPLRGTRRRFGAWRRKLDLCVVVGRALESSSAFLQNRQLLEQAWGAGAAESILETKI